MSVVSNTFNILCIVNTCGVCVEWCAPWWRGVVRGVVAWGGARWRGGVRGGVGWCAVAWGGGVRLACATKHVGYYRR